MLEHEKPGEENDEENETAGEKQTGQILETGSITGTKGKHAIHCLTVIGQIEGHFILPAQNKTTKYEHVIPQLVAIEQDPDIEGLIIILNTVGGDVEAGLAIAELIAGMKKPTVSLVLGGGHSIGVPLACSADYSIIAPSATMTIHPVRMSGLVLGVPQTLSYFDKMQERIVRFVTDNSDITGERFRELMMNKDELVMDVGTVLDGEAAVREGLIDELGGLSRVVEKLYELIEERAPEQPKKKGARRGPKPGQRKKADEPQPPKRRVGRPAKTAHPPETAENAITPMPAPPQNVGTATPASPQSTGTATPASAQNVGIATPASAQSTGTALSTPQQNAAQARDWSQWLPERGAAPDAYGEVDDWL